MAKQSKVRVCQNCNNPLPSKVKVCPSCGAKVKKPFYQRGWFIALAIIVIIGGIGNSGKSQAEADGIKQNSIEISEKEGATSSLGLSITNSDFDTSDYIKMDAELLFEYGNYMKGEKVVTVITVADSSEGLLKANTENNDSFFFSIICEFQDENYPKQFSEEDTVTVAGTVKDSDSSVGDTITLCNCTVIGLGEIADEIAGDKENQLQLGEALKSAYEKAEADAAQAEKDSYISQCETIAYSDVERNPDTYKGKLIKVTGEVIQVSEGWFDSVTMRISSNNNIWYVTYFRKDGESRILEGDNITCYGECNGVTSYTSVVGSQVTIPSMEMKYYS